MSEENAVELKVGDLIMGVWTGRHLAGRITSIYDHAATLYVFIPGLNSTLSFYKKDVRLLSADPPATKEDGPTLAVRRSELDERIRRLLAESERSNDTDFQLIHTLYYRIFDYRNDPIGENAWFWASVATSRDDARQFSWAREPLFIDNDMRRSRGRATAFLRFARQHAQFELTDAQIERIAYLIGGSFAERDAYNFEVVRGEAVYDAYHDPDSPYSCMRYHRAVQFYADNPESVGIVKISRRSANGLQYMGRVLIWNTREDKTVYDRIYPTDNGTHIQAFKTWAEAQGWVNAYQNNSDEFSVDMPSNTTNRWPYMDTFMYCADLSSGGYRLFNYDAIEAGSLLQNTDGWRGDNDGYDENGYDEDGYDEDGYDENGYDRHGYDENGYDENGYDRHGYDENGYDENGYDRRGYDENGYDREGYDAEGYNDAQLDRHGVPRNPEYTQLTLFSD